MTAEQYLGDGLFASFDGWQIKLRAPRELGDHEVFLDAQMLLSLVETASADWGLIDGSYLEMLGRKAKQRTDANP